MDGEMDGEMDDMEGMDPDADENGMDDDDDDADEHGEKVEYVKKDLVARPYHSDTLDATINEVESFTVKNSRPLIRYRVTMPRSEFGGEPPSLIDKDP